ncbi:MAG: MBL fold metallo-hydrolase [Planctomycetes bacterium]|jgi:glyoxylase-like metal-dependent hydrolase (beta-lactamase superfamily II)/8-oxo-dGTP pyrophosphatase MutT (NUDIX family)|nr:MBL fold metallo-hydrolase [Planctomycetota bacterium]
MAVAGVTEQRVAASVILTRGDGDDVEVYLVERSKRLRFFGGYLAAPGGVLDDRDGSDLVVCALRELFEETGVLLSPVAQRIADDQRDSIRAALLDGGDERWETAVASAAGIGDRLEPLCVLTTPEFAQTRYEAHFFHAELPRNEWPTIIEGELVDGAFCKPGEALRRWLEGELLIVPPMLTLLRILDEAGPGGFYEQVAVEAKRYHEGELHPVFFSPGVHMCALRTPTVPPATTTNTYLVGHRELWIVDPATPDADEQARLFDALDRYVDKGRELKGILVTHHHEDHVGAVVPTSQRYGLDVHAHRLTLERLPQGFLAGRELNDGDTIELGRAPDGAEDWRLEVLHTPGHDRGHLAFVETRYRAAVVGDLVSTVSTIVIDPPEGHMTTYMRSLHRMLEVDIQTLYPAHGPAARDGHALLRDYITHRKDREDKIVAALAVEPASLAALVATVYDDVDPAVFGLAERSLLAGLIKLEEEGRAGQVGDAWVAT